jgi:tartrate-resistant acid phosphatase type 5
MDSGILEWQNEHALTDYPLSSYIGYGDLLLDASFTQFDGFIPVLNTAVVLIDRATFNITFDRETLDIVVDSTYIQGTGVRIYGKNNRYLGSLVFGPGIFDLFLSSAGRTIVWNIPFVSTTVTSVNSKAGVYSIEGSYGNIDIKTGETSLDRSIFFTFENPIPTVISILGDHGELGPALTNVANQAKGFNPDAIILLGDTVYQSLTPETVGIVNAPYDDFRQRGVLYPVPGNHDFNPAITGTNLDDYIAYFHPPGNGRYYRQVIGHVEIFVINPGWNSNLATPLDQTSTLEPDGITPDSIQGQWLKNALSDSTAPWKIVCVHFEPYGSYLFGTTRYPGYTAVRWPYKAWGADLVLSGHIHAYERIVVDGLTYITHGLGGTTDTKFFTSAGPIIPGSQLRWPIDVVPPNPWGAIKLTALPTYLNLNFINLSNVLVDDFTITKPIPLVNPITWNAVSLGDLKDIVALKTLNGVIPVNNEVTIKESDILKIKPGLASLTFGLANSILNDKLSPEKKFV